VRYASVPRGGTPDECEVFVMIHISNDGKNGPKSYRAIYNPGGGDPAWNAYGFGATEREARKELLYVLELIMLDIAHARETLLFSLNPDMLIRERLLLAPPEPEPEDAAKSAQTEHT
jgi:hypothetical protein